MYTHDSVRVFLRPIAFCVLLVLGVGPAATLACDWACAAPAGQAHDHAGSHEQSPEGLQASIATADTPSLGSFASTCEHAVAVAPAVTETGLKVFAPVAIPVLTLVSPQVDRGHVTLVAYAIGSSPGVRSGPLSLRI